MLAAWRPRRCPPPSLASLAAEDLVYMSTDDLKERYKRTVTMAGMMAYTLTEDREEELPVTGAWTMIKKREYVKMEHEWQEWQEWRGKEEYVQPGEAEARDWWEQYEQPRARHEAMQAEQMQADPMQAEPGRATVCSMFPTAPSILMATLPTPPAFSFPFSLPFSLPFCFPSLTFPSFPFAPSATTTSCAASPTVISIMFPEASAAFSASSASRFCASRHASGSSCTVLHAFGVPSTGPHADRDRSITPVEQRRSPIPVKVEEAETESADENVMLEVGVSSCSVAVHVPRVAFLCL